MALWLVILIRVVANPAANVYQKLLTRDGAAPILVIFVSHLFLSFICAPILCVAPTPRSFDFWINITICALLAVACNTLLVQALKLGDLSLLGPINAYKSVVSLLPSLLLLGEFPSAAALCGIALIVVGSVLLVGRNDSADFPAGGSFRYAARLKTLFYSPGVRYRVAALVLSATEAAFLKRAVLASSPAIAFAWWSILGAAASGAALVVLQRGRFRDAVSCLSGKANLRRFIFLTIATGLMQYCTIVALDGFQVGPLLALFQISTLLSVFFGHRFFGEPHFLRRLFGSAIMVAGAAVVVVCRQSP
ncbi:MAG: EamA family transporter [Planctomycetia bacterium]|nr:EamA family transporter [Planctomycetia bacterium]